MPFTKNLITKICNHKVLIFKLLKTIEVGQLYFFKCDCPALILFVNICKV